MSVAGYPSHAEPKRWGRAGARGLWGRGRLLLLSVLGTAMGFAFASRPKAVATGLGGLGFVVIAVTAPEMVLVMAPPALLLGAEFVGSPLMLSAVPILLAIVVGVGMMTGRFRTYLVPHGLLALLAIWLVVSYQFAKKTGPIAIQASGSLRNCILVLALAVMTIAVAPSRRRVLLSVASMGVITSVFLRAQAVNLGGEKSLADVRVVALGYDPNGLGILMALGILATLGLSYIERQPAWLLVVALIASGLPLTKSRASLLVLVSGLAVLLLFNQSRRVKLVLALAVVGVVLFVPNAKTQVVDAVLRDRAERLDPHSDWVRKQLVIEGFKAGVRNPVMGLGFGRFPIVMEETPSIALNRDPHNQYSEFMGSSGVPALALLVAFIWLAVRARIEDRADLSLKALMVGVLVAFTTAPELYNLAGGGIMIMVIATIIGVDYQRREALLDASAPQPVAAPSS